MHFFREHISSVLTWAFLFAVQFLNSWRASASCLFLITVNASIISENHGKGFKALFPSQPKPVSSNVVPTKSPHLQIILNQDFSSSNTKHWPFLKTPAASNVRLSLSSLLPSWAERKYFLIIVSIFSPKSEMQMMLTYCDCTCNLLPPLPFQIFYFPTLWNLKMLIRANK